MNESYLQRNLRTANAYRGVRTSQGLLYLRTFADALALRTRFLTGKRIVVVGAGFIGLEVATNAIEKDSSVTVPSRSALHSTS